MSQFAENNLFEGPDGTREKRRMTDAERLRKNAADQIRALVIAAEDQGIISDDEAALALTPTLNGEETNLDEFTKYMRVRQKIEAARRDGVLQIDQTGWVEQMQMGS